MSVSVSVSVSRWAPTTYQHRGRLNRTHNPSSRHRSEPRNPSKSLQACNASDLAKLTVFAPLVTILQSRMPLASACASTPAATAAHPPNEELVAACPRRLTESKRSGLGG